MKKARLVKLSSLGDVIFNIPLANVLKKNGYEVTWLVSEKGIDVVDGNPAVKNAILVPFQRWKKNGFSIKNILEFIDIIKRIRKEKFDLALDTQVMFKSMLLMIDNYDSFVYNLVRYFEELGEEIKVFRNDKIEIEDIKNMKIDGIVISPGPKSPKEAGLSLEIIDNFKGKLPILGICLGHQCIGEYFNANIKKGKEPVHGKMFYINHNEDDLFINVKNPLRVTRYHSLIVDKADLPECLEITSETEDEVIMGIKHKDYDIYGVQFHPEAEMTEEGHKILQNFINITKKYKEKNSARMECS